MAGEISNLYGSSSYNNYNPYSANSDDFLAQQYFAQNPQVPQQGSNPMFTGYSQPQADTFQKSGGSEKLMMIWLKLSLIMKLKMVKQKKL